MHSPVIFAKSQLKCERDWWDSAFAFITSTIVIDYSIRVCIYHINNSNGL